MRERREKTKREGRGRREKERETHRFRRRFSGRWLGTCLSLHCRQIQKQRRNMRSKSGEKPLTIDNMGYVLCLQEFLFLSSANNNTSEYLKGRLSTYISRFQHIYTWMHTFGGGTVYLAQRRRTGDKKMAKLAVRSGGGYARAENESVEDEREFGTNKRKKQLHGG